MFSSHLHKLKTVMTSFATNFCEPDLDMLQSLPPGISVINGNYVPDDELHLHVNLAEHELSQFEMENNHHLQHIDSLFGGDGGFKTAESQPEPQPETRHDDMCNTECGSSDSHDDETNKTPGVPISLGHDQSPARTAASENGTLITSSSTSIHTMRSSEPFNSGSNSACVTTPDATLPDDPTLVAPDGITLLGLDIPTSTEPNDPPMMEANDLTQMANEDLLRVPPDALTTAIAEDSPANLPLMRSTSVPAGRSNSVPAELRVSLVLGLEDGQSYSEQTLANRLASARAQIESQQHYNLRPCYTDNVWFAFEDNDNSGNYEYREPDRGASPDALRRRRKKEKDRRRREQRRREEQRREAALKGKTPYKRVQSLEPGARTARGTSRMNLPAANPGTSNTSSNGGVANVKAALLRRTIVARQLQVARHAPGVTRQSPSNVNGNAARARKSDDSKHIWTAFSHPMQLYVPDSRTCHFCTIPLFCLVGWGVERHVEVSLASRGMFQEVRGGYISDGLVATRMCSKCCSARLNIIQCRVHHMKPIETPWTRDQLVNRLTQARVPEILQHETPKWCSVCRDVAEFVCRARKRSRKTGRLSQAASHPGCGLRLCASCSTKLTLSHDDDLSKMIESADKIASTTKYPCTLRADAGLLSRKGMLVRYLKYWKQQSASQ